MRTVLLWSAAGFVCFLLLFVVVSIRVSQRSGPLLDLEIDDLFFRHRIGAVTMIMKLATLPGTKTGALLLAAGGGLWAWWTHRNVLLVFVPLVVYALTLIAVTISKHVIDRVPPHHATGSDAAEHGLSFPSGHMALAVGVLGIVVVIASARLDRRGTIIVTALGAAVAAGVGLSRIYLQRHWLTDIVGGFAIAGLVLSVITPVVYLLLALRPTNIVDNLSRAQPSGAVNEVPGNS